MSSPTNKQISKFMKLAICLNKLIVNRNGLLDEDTIVIILKASQQIQRGQDRAVLALGRYPITRTSVGPVSSQ